MSRPRVLALGRSASAFDALAASDAVALAVAVDDRSFDAGLADDAFDCVLVEHAPPAVDAVTVTKRVRDVDGPPVVVCDSTSDPAVASDAVHAGALEYVPVPPGVDVERTLESVHAASTSDMLPERDVVRQYEAIIEGLADPVWVVDADGYSVYANHAYEDAFGYAKDAIEAGDLHFSETLTEESAARIREATEELIEDDLERATIEVEMVTADGTVVSVEDHFAPLRDDDGEFRGMAGVARDVSERERRERRLQVLNRVLRHNLGNDLTTISGYADLLLDDATTDVQRDRATVVRDVADRLADASRKVRQLETVVDHDPRERRAVDVVAATESAVANVERRHDDASIAVDTPASVTALAHRHLERAIEQLVENAVEHGSANPQSATNLAVGHAVTSDRPASTDAVERGGPDASSARLDASEDSSECADVRVHVQEARDGEWVTVRVADDGPGLPAHERAVVLDDDEITPTQHGSGIGLWIAKWAVESAHGELVVPDDDDADDEVDGADEAGDADGAVVVVRLEPVSD